MTNCPDLCCRKSKKRSTAKSLIENHTRYAAMTQKNKADSHYTATPLTPTATGAMVFRSHLTTIFREEASTFLNTTIISFRLESDQQSFSQARSFTRFRKFKLVFAGFLFHFYSRRMRLDQTKTNQMNLPFNTPQIN